MLPYSLFDRGPFVYVSVAQRIHTLRLHRVEVNNKKDKAPVSWYGFPHGAESLDDDNKQS